MPSPTGQFTRALYQQQQAESRAAAEVLIPLVLQHTQARSVVDVGCGAGAWLAVCASQGLTDILGLDGAAAGEMLQVPAEQFRPADLRQPPPLGRTFDLAMSLEVAEHLPPEVAEAFVAYLVAAAPMVLFSAAIPGQYGDRHINEQWPSYWARLFARHDYLSLDVFRPQIWTHPQVSFWYRQNMLLYVRRDRVPANYTPPQMLDVVHPELYENQRRARLTPLRRWLHWARATRV